jgi:hypothetical protein
MAIGNLTVDGGTVYLKQVTLNLTLTYGANILIIEDYQGIVTYYRDGRKITLNEPASEASYVVGQYNSTYYYGKNGTTGNYDFLSTNASYVFESIINGNIKTSIFIKIGTYDLSTLGNYLNPAGKDITIIGESWDDTVFLDSRSGTTYTFNTIASSSPTANFTIKNVKFDRRIAYDAGTTAKGCVGGSFFKLEVEHCQFWGNVTYADGSSHYLTTAVCGDWASDYFVNCYFRNNRVINFQYGITSPHSTYTEVSGNYFENCHTQTVGIQLPVENGNYIVTNNFLYNCAEFDEGIAIDSTNPASAVNVNALISDNVIYADASHDPVKSICVITTSGVKISGNKIVTLSATDSDWWGQIGVEGRDYCDLMNITISDNDIWTMQHVGIEARSISKGAIKNNVVHMAQAWESYGIRLRYTKAITYAGICLTVSGNDVYTSLATNSRHALSVEASAGTGSIAVIVDNNYFSAYIGIETDYASLLTTKIGKNNIFNTTTKVLNSGASYALYYEAYGTATIVAGQNHVHVNPYLVGTPIVFTMGATNSTTTLTYLIVSATEVVVTQTADTGYGSFSYYTAYLP